MAGPRKAGGSKKGATPRKAASGNPDVERLTRELLEFRDYNRIPSYLPIRTRNASGRAVITGYQNTRTGEVVTPRYYKAMENAFTTNAENVRYGTPGSKQNFTPTEISRAEAFLTATEQRRRRTRVRGASIVESYQLKQASEGRILSKDEVTRDPYFQALRDELESYTAQHRSFTNENYEREIRGSPLDPGNVPNRTEIINAQAAALRNLLGTSERYQEVLIELGRRLPGDTRPVGSYKSGELKLMVQPFYEQVGENYPGDIGVEY